MMRINFAHLNIRGVDIAVFDAKPTINTEANRIRLLSDLTSKAKNAGLIITQSALAYSEGFQVVFYGSQDLVRYLQHEGLPQWTHWIDI